MPREELADGVGQVGPGKKARPARRQTPRWSAERRAPVANGCPRRKAWRLIRMRRLALHPLDLFEGQEASPAKRGRDYGVPGTAKPRAMTHVCVAV